MTAATLAIGENGSKIAYFPHSAGTAHSPPPKVHHTMRYKEDTNGVQCLTLVSPTARQPGCMQQPRFPSGNGPSPVSCSTLCSRLHLLLRMLVGRGRGVFAITRRRDPTDPRFADCAVQWKPIHTATYRGVGLGPPHPTPPRTPAAMHGDHPPHARTSPSSLAPPPPPRARIPVALHREPRGMTVPTMAGTWGPHAPTGPCLRYGGGACRPVVECAARSSPRASPTHFNAVPTRLATSIGQLRHDPMEQGPTEPHAGCGTFLLSSGGAGGRVLLSGP